MSKQIIFVILALAALHVDALVVNNHAGKLSEQVTDMDITTLTVSGTMNARDFYFVADNLHKLSTVDLSDVVVEACYTNDSHYWQRVFAANEVPVGAFADLPLTNMKLPSGLTSIGKAAFAGCTALTDVTLPVTLDSIADFAFAGCSSLTSVQLPARVSYVGNGAFMRCTSLTEFTVEPDSRLVKLDEAALMDCPALNHIALGQSLMSMGERALAGSSLQELDLTQCRRLLSVGDWAMVKTPVTNVKMPASLTSLGAGAFLYASELNSITLGGKVSTVSDYLLAGTGLNNELDLTGVSSLGDFALYNVDRLTYVELPSTTTWLGTRAMAGMVGMTALTCHAEEVPALGNEVWRGVNQQSIPLTVPEDAQDAYRTAPQWRNFLFETGWLKGDVNGDGEVNVADINAIVSIILGRPADDDTMLRADVNGDGEINIADINAVVDIILHPQNYIPVQVNTCDELHLDDVTIKPGEERTLNLTIDNAETYSALQFDLTLPQGLTLVTTTADKGRQQEMGRMGESVRTVVYSMKNNCFDGNGKAVLKITVLADESLENGGCIALSNIVLADENNVSWHAADCNAQVTNSTGIEDLTATADRVWVEDRILCIETRQAGSAQVNAINGVARKMELMEGITRQELEPGFYVIVLNNRSYKIIIK